jgi:hypothetical protein
MSKNHGSLGASTARETLEWIRRRLGLAANRGEIQRGGDPEGAPTRSLRGEKPLEDHLVGTKPISRKWVWIVGIPCVGRVRISPLRPQRGDAEVR